MPDIAVADAAGVRPNPALVAALAPLLAMFGHEEHPFDPWWWPIRVDRVEYSWGIDAERATALGLPGRNPARVDYPGFLGSVGADVGAVMVISTRPSQGAFPSSSCTALYRLLDESGLVGRAHVTDLVKLRGPGSDDMRDRGLSLGAWVTSLECLHRELSVIQPSVLLVLENAFRWVTDWTDGQSRFGRWRNALGRDHVLVLERLREEGRRVPFWAPQFKTKGKEKEILARWGAAAESPTQP